MSQEFTFSSSNLGRNESKLINNMHHIIDTLYLCHAIVNKKAGYSLLRNFVVLSAKRGLNATIFFYWIYQISHHAFPPCFPTMLQIDFTVFSPKINCNKSIYMTINYKLTFPLFII